MGRFAAWAFVCTSLWAATAQAQGADPDAAPPPDKPAPPATAAPPAKPAPPAAAPPATAAPAQPPPPQYGYPPPGYPPPGYPPPPGYYPVPYYVPVHEPPPPWKPGDPAPPGYHVETRVDVKTIRSGAGLLVGMWLISVIAGAVLNEGEQPKSEDGDDVEPGDWKVLYWPVAGPFLAMGNVSTDDGGWALLLIDGVLQSVGFLGIIIGLVSHEEYLERNSRSRTAPRIRVAPLVGPRQAGMGLVGAF